MSVIHSTIGQLSTVDRFVLLLLGAGGGEPVPSPVHLQNGMCMLSKVLPEIAEDARFGPSPLGAHSEAVEARVAGLETAGLVERGPGGFALTEEGRKAYGAAKARSDKKGADTTERFKEFFNDLTRDEFLAFMCFTCHGEEYADKESGEYKRLVPMRRDLALSIYGKDKVSAQKAAYVSGECFEDFFGMLRNEARKKNP